MGTARDERNLVFGCVRAAGSEGKSGHSSAQRGSTLRGVLGFFSFHRRCSPNRGPPGEDKEECTSHAMCESGRARSAWSIVASALRAGVTLGRLRRGHLARRSTSGSVRTANSAKNAHSDAAPQSRAPPASLPKARGRRLPAYNCSSGGLRLRNCLKQQVVGDLERPRSTAANLERRGEERAGIAGFTAAARLRGTDEARSRGPLRRGDHGHDIG